MNITFRWYGESDPVTLSHIAQIPAVDGIVSAVYSVPPGGLWSEADIAEIKNSANAKNLSFEVVESVPVHEDIKLGIGKRDEYISNYIENVKRLGRAGVKVICYNFMPVFDWLRTDLAYKYPDGSNALVYRHETVLSLDPRVKPLSLPGWDESYTKEQLAGILKQYENMDKEALWRNFEYFINAVTPECEKAGVLLAIHPDDPPWDIFGLPRIITGMNSYDRMKRINPSTANGITLCLGSLGCSADNDIPVIIKKHAERIYFVHARNVKIYEGNKDFDETAHLSKCGSVDMRLMLKTLHECGFDGYMRPDHGRMIWGETGKPGYGLYDRALGAMYLYGLWEAFS